MGDLLFVAMHNCVAALMLGLAVFTLTRIWRSPPVAHVLWLLVLIKLISPPLMRVDWSDAADAITFNSDERNSPQTATNTPRPSVFSAGEMPMHPAERRMVENEATLSQRPHVDVGIALWWSRAQRPLFWIWMGGSVFCAVAAGVRIDRFHKMLKNTLPAPRKWHELTREITTKLGLATVPDVRIVACVGTPMVWCFGRRPVIVLPMSLLGNDCDDKAAMILAHELAHVRRRDHWVRGIEMIVAILYWWNPVVRLVRSQLHQAEDECCDAWVDWILPNRNNVYAQTLLEIAEQYGPSRAALPALASPFLGRYSLKARIEMILQSRLTRRASPMSNLLLAVVAIVALPLFVQFAFLADLAAAADKQTKQEGTRAAAKSADGYKQLQRIGLALHGYHDIFGHFPPATLVGPDGKTQHSWRVEIVPMLKYYAYEHKGENVNFKPNDREGYWKLIANLGYDLNAPWDNPANKKFTSEYGEKYWNLDGDPKSVNSRYFVVTGPNTVFADDKGTPLSAITDEPSKTLFVVEAKRDVSWTKPDDLAVSKTGGAPALGGFDKNGYVALTCDGAVHFIPQDTDPKAIDALITPRSGDSFTIEGIPVQLNP